MNLHTWIKGGRRGAVPEYLALPLELEDGRPAYFHGKMLRYCAIGIAVAAFWATATPIRELAIAPGQIMPEGDVRSVQHLEGGIVATVVAQAGVAVHKGDPILILADDQAGHRGLSGPDHRDSEPDLHQTRARRRDRYRTGRHMPARCSPRRGAGRGLILAKAGGDRDVIPLRALILVKAACRWVGHGFSISKMGNKRCRQMQ